MASRIPRFTTPFRNEFEEYEPISSTRPKRARYQDPNAERGAADYRSEIDKLYGTGEAMEKFYSHVQNVPRQEDYGPGILGRITAGLAGVSSGWQQGAGAGIKTSQAVLRRPYEQAVEEYEMKGQGLKAAADIEQARDAKRVQYFETLRKFDKDEYDRLNEEAKIENARITAEARAAQAQTAARIADLTAARDKATDERERQKISAEIKKAENDLAVRQEANKIREHGVRAFEGRSGVMERVGMDRNKRIGGGSKPREVVISPQAQRTAEIDATQAVLNSGEYESLRPFVDIKKDYVDIKSAIDGWFSNSNADPELLKKFKNAVEQEKKKKLNLIIQLNKGDDDIIDLDDDDEPF